MGEVLEIFCRYCEKNVLKSCAIKVARNVAGTADSLDGLFVAYVADSSADRNLFHLFCKNKMCYSVLAGIVPGRPHCTKSRLDAAFNKGLQR